MRAALVFAACVAAASCAGSGDVAASASAPAQPDPGATAENDAPPDRDAAPAPTAPEPRGDDPPASVAELRCFEGPLAERIRVRFGPGHTGRELAVWYTTTTCQPITSTRDLLGRATLTQIDALAHRAELDELFDSLLRGLGLVAVKRGDMVEIVADTGEGPDAIPAGAERIVLLPADEDDTP